MGDPNSTSVGRNRGRIANSCSVGEKKESAFKKFLSKVFGGNKKEKKPETQEVAQSTTQEAPAKPTDEPKVSFTEPEPQQEDPEQAKRASGVKDLAPHSRPMSLFVQKGIEDSDDEPLSCSDTSSDESDEIKKDPVTDAK